MCGSSAPTLTRGFTAVLTVTLTATLVGRILPDSVPIPTVTPTSPYPGQSMDIRDDCAPSPCATPPAVTRQWCCSWHAGPDAGATHDLPPGRHLLGRADTATIRSDDPALQPHHALVEVRDDGRVTLTQLTGRRPVQVDGAAVEGTVELVDGAWVEVGDSLLSFDRSPRPTPRPVHLHEGSVVRVTRAVPHWQPVELGIPDAPTPDDDRIGGLAPAIVGIAGSGVLALVTRQPTFLLFGALGAAVALASWGAQHCALARRRRRTSAEHAQAAHAAREADARCREAFRQHHTSAVPTLVGALAITTPPSRASPTDALWTRRPTHGDAFLAALGIGEVPWPQPDGAAATNEVRGGLAIPVAVGPGCRLALRGPQAPAIARALLAQLTASCGPADLRVVVVTQQPDAWGCLRDLPHLALPDGSAAVVTECGLTNFLAELDGHRANLLVVTDVPAVLATRTSPVRRLLADPDLHALVAVLPAEAPVPQLCTGALTTSAGPTATWLADTRTNGPAATVRAAGLGPRAMARCSATLRGLVDPEDPLSVAARMPRSLSLVDLYGGAPPHAAAIAHTWMNGTSDPSPRALVGLAADGVVDIDLVRDGPHGLIAGTTGAGKSELLRTLVIGMAANASPTHLNFVLVDYKGGATFDACATLPHVVGVVTDLDDRLADRALRSLQAELRRREALLREHGAADLPALRATAPQVVLPRLVVVIDEFAALVADQPAFLHSLVGIAQRGRSLGVHLLLATQRPNGVISDDIRANTNLRLALRLQDTADALDVVGSVAPAHLPRQVPGRAVLRLDADEHLTFQTAQCTGPAASPAPGQGSVLQGLARSIIEAARLAGTAKPASPWQPPLPRELATDELASGALGLVDDPDRQRIVPLLWQPTDGHLLIAGSAGSGVTSTLCTLAAHTLRSTTDHVYVLDGYGSNAFEQFTTHPRFGATIGVHEGERLSRLLQRLRSRPDVDDENSPRTVLFIDGLDIVRRTLDDISTADQFDALARLLAGDHESGVTVIAGAQHTAAVPMAFLTRCPHRWVLHLHDPQDAAVVGVPAVLVQPPLPGRAVLAGAGRTAQIVAPTRFVDDPAATRHAVLAPRIEAVPAIIEPAALATGWRHDGTTALAVGTDLGTGATHLLRVHDGEHVLVTGGSR
ncbi:MAG: FtsK/SpoIIIE domain-containing protein [Actinomycetota bacterium]